MIHQDTLFRWNRWGKNPLPSGFQRQILEKIIPFIETEDIITLIGLRRSGKTTVLFQLIDYLKSIYSMGFSTTHCFKQN